MFQSQPWRKWCVFYVEVYVIYQQPSEPSNCTCSYTQELTLISLKQQQHRHKKSPAAILIRLLSSYNMQYVYHVCDAWKIIICRDNDSLLAPKIIVSRSSDFTVLCVLKYRQTIWHFAARDFLCKQIKLYIGIVGLVNSGSKSPKWFKVNSDLYKILIVITQSMMYSDLEWESKIRPLGMTDSW